MRVCTKCQVLQPEDNFAKRAGRNTRRTQCDSCRAAYNRAWAAANRAANREKVNASVRASYYKHHEKSVARASAWNKENKDRVRESHYRRKYGITLADYQSMFDEQGGLCAVCDCPETATDSRSGKVRGLHVDHDHVTKQVRGLLCTRCNMAVGYLLDDPERATALAAYLVNRTAPRTEETDLGNEELL